jgi:hypothetical protein
VYSFLGVVDFYLLWKFARLGVVEEAAVPAGAQAPQPQSMSATA